MALSEAEVHWRAFLESLVARGMRGVGYVVSDDHSGLRAAGRAVLGGATWQRCQFHLARNAIHHAPNADIRKRIGKQLKSVWTADDLTKAETALAELVASYRDTAPKLAYWLEENVPEALAVFTLPEPPVLSSYGHGLEWDDPTDDIVGDSFHPTAREERAGIWREENAEARDRELSEAELCWLDVLRTTDLIRSDRDHRDDE